MYKNGYPFAFEHYLSGQVLRIEIYDDENIDDDTGQHAGMCSNGAT